LTAAQQDVDRALREHAPQSEKWAWRFRLLKAQILVSQSAYKETLVLLNENLPVELASTEIAVQRKILQGIAHRYGQQFADADKDLEDAQIISNALPLEFLCRVLIARGDLEVDERKYVDAEASYQKALSIAKQEKLSILEANILGNLGRLSTSQEYFDEAIDRNYVALQLSRSLNMKSSVTTILGNMGWGYFQLGDFDNALSFYKQAEEISEEAGLTGYRIFWLTGIANVSYVNHDYASAEAISKQALELARALDDRETITESLNRLSQISLETNRIELAEQYNQDALQLEEAGLEHFGTLRSLLLSGRIASAKGSFNQAEIFFRRVLRDRNSDTPVRWEAQARLAKLYDDRGLPQKADREYRRSINTIDAARASITRDESRLTFLSSGIEFYEDYAEFLIKHGRTEDALKVAELSRARTLAEGLSSKSVALATTATTSKIKPQLLAQQLHSTLLFYWLGYRNSHLWVITPSKITTISLPAESEIDSLVKPYREAAAKSKDIFATDSTTGQKLYEMLVQPAKKLIPINSRVILFPDGKLYGLNFETLIVSEPQPHFWIEDVTLTTASSLSLLADSVANRTSSDKRLLLVGDTVTAGTNFASLPQAADEMRQVAHYFPASDRTILQGSNATPASYLGSNPGQFSYLHFVTHGTASRTRPLESAVVLSKEPDGDSYKLYARDIVAHRLKADLVTISACNGSGTRAYSGEGLVGLSWAFLRAGAHNVIGALWEVSDASTPRLMNELYGELAKGHDPASALRTAKLSLLHSKDVYRKPFYWAPFQLYAGS